MKQALAKLAIPLARMFLRYGPDGRLKKALWERIVQPYLGWRRFAAVARSRLGPRFHVALPDLIQSYVYFFGIWEPNITAYIVRALRGGDCFVDVGANVGYYSLLASRIVGSPGKVFAVEASPTIFKELMRNIQLNAANNVVACNVAAHDAQTRLKLFRAGESNIGATTTFADRAREKRFVLEGEVNAAPIEEIVPVADVLRARLIKIDVEGAEWFVIRGMEHLLSRMSPETEILVEVDPLAMAKQGGEVRAFLSKFAQAGFGAYVIPNDYSPSAYFSNRPIMLPLPLQGDMIVRTTDVLFRRPR